VYPDEDPFFGVEFRSLTFFDGKAPIKICPANSECKYHGAIFNSPDSCFEDKPVPLFSMHFTADPSSRNASLLGSLNFTFSNATNQVQDVYAEWGGTSFRFDAREQMALKGGALAFACPDIKLESDGVSLAFEAFTVQAHMHGGGFSNRTSE